MGGQAGQAIPADTRQPMAASGRILDACRMLCEGKANIEAKLSPEEENESTALHLAVLKVVEQSPEGPNTVQVLLGHGANPNVRTTQMGTPLHLVVSASGNAEIVQSLIQGAANLNAKMEGGSAPLKMAFRMGYTMIVELLLEAKCEVHGSQGADSARRARSSRPKRVKG